MAIDNKQTNDGNSQSLNGVGPNASVSNDGTLITENKIDSTTNSVFRKGLVDEICDACTTCTPGEFYFKEFVLQILFLFLLFEFFYLFIYLFLY